jgi:trehalose 6-phosphate synthase
VSRLVAVSNRISIPKRGASPGGLVVGLLAAMQSRGGLWFGWSGETTNLITPPTIERRGNVEYVTTGMEETEYRDSYLGF